MTRPRPVKQQAEPQPRHQYPVTKVDDSDQAQQVERELRRQFSEPNFVFLAIGRVGRGYEIVMDSGTTPLQDEVVDEVRLAAAAAKKKLDLAPAD